jgi:hypothetical protein
VEQKGGSSELYCLDVVWMTFCISSVKDSTWYQKDLDHSAESLRLWGCSGGVLHFTSCNR